MVNFKKIVAVLCSATMIVAAPITAFAEDPAPTDPASTTTGAGNIVAYSFETLTVPTAVKVSFNPQGWDFTLRGEGDDAVTSDSQIVSLNYGISSMATMNRKVTVSFAAEGTASSGEGEVVFVDSAEKATAKTAENTDGAGFGEYKLYLAVAPSTAAVTKGYKADDASEVAFEVDENHASTVTAALLSDVDMTAKATAAQTFMPGEDDANASIGYKLNKATYELTDDAVIDFTTTSADMADLVQPATLGSIVGFTFVGAMNTNCDWTKAKLSAIKITPTYEVEDADGEETDYEDGGYNQITTEPAAPSSYVSANTISASSNSVTLSMPEGVTVTGAKLYKASALDTPITMVAGTNYTVADETFAVPANMLTAWGAGSKITIEYSDDHTDELTIQ
jgi:hypothetical protein